MINLELYRIFKILAEEENLTKVSEILHISLAVTKHIKNYNATRKYCQIYTTKNVQKILPQIFSDIVKYPQML